MAWHSLESEIWLKHSSRSFRMTTEAATILHLPTLGQSPGTHLPPCFLGVR